MSSTPGPIIPINGLVLCFDPANEKSYAGDSTTNLMTTNPIPTSATGYVAAGGTGDAISYDSVKQAVKWQRNTYDAWGAYLYNNLSFTGTFNLSLQYTASFEWYSESQYRSELVSWQLCDGAQTNTVASANLFWNSVSIGDGWYRFSYTFTPLTTGASAIFRLITSDRGALKTSFWWRKLQLEQKSYLTPFVDGSRTASFTDISNNLNSGAVSGSPVPFYSAVNQKSVSFDGVDDMISVTTTNGFGNAGLSPNQSMSFWVKYVDNNVFDFLCGFRNDTNYDFYALILDTGTNSLEVRTRTASTAVQADVAWPAGYNNTWKHVAITVSGTLVSTYVDGQLGNTSNILSGNFGATSGNFTIGRTSGGFPLSGYMSNVLFYNRAISASEVSQIFNAQRGRYAI